MNKKFAKVTSVITVAFAMLTFGGNVNAATNLANVNANFPEQSNSSPLRKCPKPAKILYF